MNRKSSKFAIVAVCCALLAFSGCADNTPNTEDASTPTPTASATQTPTSAPTSTPTEAPAPTDAAAPSPTDTPAPTPTPLPTDTPAPTPTPSQGVTLSTPTPNPSQGVTLSTPTPKPGQPTSTPKPVATSTPKATSTPTPTPTPTPIPTSTPTPRPERTISEILPDLRAAGVIAANPDKVTAAPTVSGNVEIEKAQTFDNGFIVVTLNARLNKVNASDITLKKYKTDWYALSDSTTDMTIKETFSTVNEEGKTVIIYDVTDKMEGTKVVDDTSAKKFSNLAAEVKIADNYLSWQMDHGGWDKKVDEQAKKAWNGVEKKNKFSGWTGKNGEMLGTIDNEATYTQMRHIAAVYREVPDAKYKESVLKGLDFIFKLQYESGGFAQVYPRRGNYSDNVTFNDNAMINVLKMLEAMRDRKYPFDSDIIPDDYMVKIEASIDKAVDYILKAQIVQQGKLTAWCAQHNPTTYAPVKAREYELPSISGSESVAIVQFLMNQEQTPEIATAVESAIQWFRDSEAKNITYIKDDPNGVYFVESPGSSLWYRFYDIENNLPIFCSRDGIKKHNIAEITEERRNGYAWSGTWPRKLLQIYDKCGYYAGRIELKITGSSSVTSDNKTLLKSSVAVVNSEITLK